MPRKTLERLTFDYLRAWGELRDALETYKLLNMPRNRMLAIEAELRFINAAQELQLGLGDSNLAHYLQGLQDLAKTSIEFMGLAVDSSIEIDS